MQFLPLSRGNRDKLRAELVSLAWVMGGSLSGRLSHLRSLFTGHVHTWGTPIQELRIHYTASLLSVKYSYAIYYSLVMHDTHDSKRTRAVQLNWRLVVYGMYTTLMEIAVHIGTWRNREDREKIIFFYAGPRAAGSPYAAQRRNHDRTAVCHHMPDRCR